MTYRTPDVYVEEISVFPPSVAEVETAVPAFIGYTAKATNTLGNDLSMIPTKVTSLLEYERLFGGAPKPVIETINLDDTNNFVSAQLKVTKHLYDGMRLFFDNGGGKCYIVSVGSDTAATDKDKLIEGLKQIAKQDEPTILLFPDAAELDADGLAAVQVAALNQCGKLGDRVALLDTHHYSTKESHDSEVSSLRNKIGINNLKYGAAYAPWIKIGYAKNVGYADIKSTIKKNGTQKTLKELASSDKDLEKLIDDAETARTALEAANKSINTATTAAKTATENANAKAAAANAVNATDADKAAAEKAAADATKAADAVAKAVADASKATKNSADAEQALLANFAVYSNLIRGINSTLTACPPSAAVAGIYALMDSTRGVWKAPANISLTGVIEPTYYLDTDDTDNLNVDAVAGKSINAIRAFSGKGTLIWGARTLAGNDNEWRYISVRRFFNMVEESVKKSTHWAVFEPNDANTWTKVRGMIENYLTQKWREGALAGATTKEAFFVRCGLGVTMNAQDILEGRMNVEIGMAAVRPAEFIILKFSHKLQTS